ncbi:MULTISPECIES: signal peptidase I [Nocardiaceae]|uniref:signal peptidase I n=1 Tax=Nocardiaceae TaxID=85025 RepID=UPI00056D1519|nr:MULTISPECIES: signal peptidase I [Rhodococcus]OZE94765.1 S26 family signal peptidase [Rhodococcus sp. 15-1189-1-1a]OZF09076.1 S26 family signal peptidase [Rhodococcus sp. 14-2686-1-2]OZF42918.1 S26 family signal peptidase [Rhodococcus sp. 14-2470-1b]
MSDAPQDPHDRSESRSDEPNAPRKEKKKQRSFWRELPILVLVALVLSFLLQTFIARVYLIPSESMEPTLHGCAGCTGDRIVVEKIGYRFGDPKPGDVVVFRGPDSWNSDFVSTRSDNTIVRGAQEVGSLIGIVAPDENDLVKRVIATGGQTVECCDDQGRVLVDGKPLDEPYVQMDFPFTPGVLTCDTELKSGRCFPAVTVPEGNLWVMGDNRSNSADSRFHVSDELMGTVPVDNVIGKAFLIALPPSRWGTLDSPDIQGQ